MAVKYKEGKQEWRKEGRKGRRKMGTEGNRDETAVETKSKTVVKKKRKERIREEVTIEGWNKLLLFFKRTNDFYITKTFGNKEREGGGGRRSW